MNPVQRLLTRVIPVLAVTAVCTSPASAQSARTTPADLAGEWRLEFSSEPNTADPTARSQPWLTFIATIVQVDSAMGGSMRSDGPTGQFGCKRSGSDACIGGRMRLSWDEQDWQVFEFRVTPGDPNRGTGKAEIRFQDGQTDRYSFVMSRTGR